MARSAKSLRAHCRHATPADAFALVNKSGKFRSNQKPHEILPLLGLLDSLKPQRICEIGAEGGGNLLLFSLVAAPDAQILSIDIEYSFARRWSYPHLAGPQQRVSCIRGDSHAPQRLEMVRSQLQDAQLDFLFIDGDHSGRGVAQDFDMYSPLVRSGGIIAFHDIVPDFHTRYGAATVSDVGEVPAFWAELKQRYGKTREFVQDAAQDGFGIGVLEWDGPQRP